MEVWQWGLVAAVIVGLVGVALPDDDRPDSVPRVVTDRIDRFATDSDCVSLQEEFNIADNRNATDVMEYIDDAMREVGCYG